MNRITSRFKPLAPWIVFILALCITIGWAARSIAVGAQQMKAADTRASEFAAFKPGDHAKAVVQIEKVEGNEIAGILLERKSDTEYRKPEIESCLRIRALLSEGTSVVMGKPSDITPKATVQIDGIVNDKHVLLASQVAILTGYVTVLGVNR